MSDDLVAIGRIGPARGVRGDVFVQPWTDDPDARFAPGAVLRTSAPATGDGTLTVETSSTAGGKLVVHFSGIDDRTAAEQLRGLELLIPVGERPALEDPDEYYASDLVGLTAVSLSGDVIGAVRDVVDIAGADYLVLDVEGRERLVPFVSAIVPEVDIAGGRVSIDPPEGLFDL